MKVAERAGLGARVAALLPEGWSYGIRFTGRSALVTISAAPEDYDHLYQIKSSDADGILWRIIIEHDRLVSSDHPYPNTYWITKMIGVACPYPKRAEWPYWGPTRAELEAQEKGE